MEKKKVLKILKIIGFVIGLFVILYFVSQNLFFSIISFLLLFGIPLGSLALVLTPLWITKRLYKVERFTFKSVLTALPLIFLFTLIVWKLDKLLVEWLFAQMGKGLLQTF